MESSHAIAFAVKLAKELGPDKSMIVCLSGRGDKDVFKSKTAWKQMQQRREKLMPKTLTEKLNAIKAAGKGIFVPYIMAGDHEKGLDGLGETIHFLEDLGVSAIEVGIPFSDPVADGPVIQNASYQAIQKGTTLTKIFDMVEGVRKEKCEVPIVFMMYYNYSISLWTGSICDTLYRVWC